MVRSGIECAAAAVALAAGACGAAFEPAMPSSAEITGRATARVEKRISRDLPIKKDMTAVKAFQFDLCVSNPADFTSYVCYFKSGEGWYKTLLELPDDAAPGGWYPMAVTTRGLDTEGRPAGWRNVEAVRIAGYRATTNAVSLALRNIGFDVSWPEAYVIGEGRQGDGLARRLEELGVETRLIAADDLKAGVLDGVAFVAVPSARTLPPHAAALVEAYAKKGGKLMKVGMRLPAGAALLEEAERLLPGVRARYEARQAAMRAEEARMLAATRAMPSRAGERRLIWCHSAWGLGGTNDWDSTCRFLGRNGITDLIVNLAWGGYVYYPSKVLPQADAARGDALEQCRAACRKHGIKMHVWKVCWKMGRAVSAEFVQAAKAAGRVQVGRDNSFDDCWNCPSDPHNQRLEIDAMTELALEKKVDGIHFDYIRYPSANCCFCEGCRKRFEARLGRTVASWPRDVGENGPLYEEWAAFRCDNISRVVRTVHERVRAAKSNVEISAAVFRDPARDPYVVGQEWVRWCGEGWLDFVCPMDYMTSPKRYADRIALQNAALKAAGSKAKFYPGMAVMCSHFKAPLTPLVIAQEIAAVRAEGLDGFTLFSIGGAAKLLPVLREGPLAARDPMSPRK